MFFFLSNTLLEGSIVLCGNNSHHLLAHDSLPHHSHNLNLQEVISISFHFYFELKVVISSIFEAGPPREAREHLPGSRHPHHELLTPFPSATMKASFPSSVSLVGREILVVLDLQYHIPGDHLWCHRRHRLEAQ